MSASPEGTYTEGWRTVWDRLDGHFKSIAVALEPSCPGMRWLSKAEEGPLPQFQFAGRLFMTRPDTDLASDLHDVLVEVEVASTERNLRGRDVPKKRIQGPGPQMAAICDVVHKKDDSDLEGPSMVFTLDPAGAWQRLMLEYVDDVGDYLHEELDLMRNLLTEQRP